MCDPVSIGLTTLALGAANTAGGMLTNAANQQTAKAQDLINQQQIALKTAQEREQAAAKIGGYQREAASATADTLNRASEGGLSGNTINALVGDLHNQEATREGYVQRNLQATEAQLKMQSQSSSVTAAQTVAANNPLTTLVIGGAQAALGGFNAYSGAASSADKVSALTNLLNKGS